MRVAWSIVGKQTGKQGRQRALCAAGVRKAVTQDANLEDARHSQREGRDEFGSERS